MTPEEAIKDIEENIKPIIGGQSLELAIKALRIIDCPYIKDECSFCGGCEDRDEMNTCSNYEEKKPAVAPSRIAETEELESYIEGLRFRMTRLEETILLLSRGAQMTLKKYTGAGLEDWELDDLIKKINEIHKELYGAPEEEET